ncbi:MAG: nitroreductase family protein [Peptoniphilus sp.]|nr:nitroreductase family protein [Peptoniphilus sp.]
MFEDLIKNRRSIRKYSDKKIDKKDLESILKAGLYSPTAKGRDCLHFVAVEDEDTLLELSKFKNNKESFIKDCQVAVAVLTDKDVADITYSQDACIAATFLMFAATELGIGSCFVNVRSDKDPDGFNASKKVRELLDIPEKYNVECILSMGYPLEEVREKQPFDFETHVSYERF